MSKVPFTTKEKLEEIAKVYPTPFHLYDEAGIRKNAENLKKAFAWNKGFKEYFKEVEEAELSESFWNVGLVQNLETSSITSPYFNTYIAAQVWNAEQSLFSSTTKVSDLVAVTGDVHHIFPKEYLRQNGYEDKSKYNQVANYTYLDTGVNISIGKKRR